MKHYDKARPSCSSSKEVWFENNLSFLFEHVYNAVDFGRPSWFVDLQQEGGSSDVSIPPSGVAGGVIER